MIRRVLFAVIALSALTSIVSIATVAGAFALYVMFRDSLGEAGAAAVVAAIAAALVAVVTLIVVIRARSSWGRPSREPSLTDRLMQVARDRPILAAGGALAAGLIALKNPQAAAGLVSAFLAGKSIDRDRRR